MPGKFARACRAALLALALLGASVAGATAEGTKSFPTNKNAIPIVKKTDQGTTTLHYSQLGPREKRHMDQVLAALKKAEGQQPQVSKKLDAGPGGTVGFGCGWNSTGAEPYQFGCWHGGKTCYVSLSNTGEADFGCHECNGDNCPRN
ncbi:hypothetical protein [Pelagibius marinus]|uniref:hypothetical protein n=1 Tax=Pelagibius marinus TaxID=2762760 RepID=UPI00187278D2|nr:hypothetical protein [Pelagibius marinus]